MNKIKNAIRRANYKLRHDFFSVENVVLFLAIVLCFTWTYQSIKAMSRNWELSEKITASRKDLELAKIEVELAEIENEYYKSEEYQEIAARKNLDKQYPGEHMVVMPENSVEAKNDEDQNKVTVEPEKEYSNFEKWMKFLLPKY